jgi:uncharacterized protein YkwD
MAKRLLVPAFALLLLAAPAALARRAGPRVGTDLKALDASVLAGLNAIRAAHGLVPLREDPALAAAAYAHSAQMVADGYFAHASLDGAPFWTRLSAYARGAPRGAWSAGENLLWASPGVDAAGALRLWMASPGHRANILAPRWREVGVAAIHAGAAPGTYGGRPVTVITVDFGAR